MFKEMPATAGEVQGRTPQPFLVSSGDVSSDDFVSMLQKPSPGKLHKWQIKMFPVFIYSTEMIIWNQLQI